MSEAAAEPDFETKKAISNLQSLGVAQYLMGGMGLVSPLMAYSQRAGRHMGGAMERLDRLLWAGEVGFYLQTALASSVVVALFLLAVGSQTSKMRPIARPLTLAHVGLGFANGLYNTWVTFGVMIPALLAFADREGAVGLGGAIGGIIGGAVGGIFGFLFPAIELWMITRPKARAILEGRATT